MLGQENKNTADRPINFIMEYHSMRQNTCDVSNLFLTIALIVF